MWFFFALVGYILQGAVLASDKFILTRSIPEPIVYTFYSTVFLLTVWLLIPFGVAPLYGTDWWVAAVAGGTFVLALGTMYHGIKRGEATHLYPFNGGILSLTLLFISLFILHESLRDRQIVGIVCLILATFLLAFEKKEKKSGIHIGFFWVGLSGVLFATSLTAAKYLYEVYPFVTAFVSIQGMMGLGGLSLMIHPAVRQSWRHRRGRPLHGHHGHPLWLVGGSKLMGALAGIMIQYAVATGSVVLVGALGGLQYVALFGIVFCFTKFFPRVLKEYFTTRELIAESMAIILLSFGSALFIL